MFKAALNWSLECVFAFERLVATQWTEIVQSSCKEWCISFVLCVGVHAHVFTSAVSDLVTESPFRRQRGGSNLA